MKLANKNPLNISDFEGVREKDQSENLLKPVSEKWYQEKDKIKDGIMEKIYFINQI